MDKGQVPRPPPKTLTCQPRANRVLSEKQCWRGQDATQRGTGEPLHLSSKAALALPDLLRPGQVRTKAGELYVQTCGGGKKDKSAQMRTIATALHAVNAAGGTPTAHLLGAQVAR